MKIEQWLKATGMSQTELARASGVNLRQISRLVSGESALENMTGKNILAISEALGVSVEELLRGQEPEGGILRARDILTAEAMDGLDPAELRQIVKVERAKDWSGWRRYPSTCDALARRIPAEWWGIYSARHIGEIMRIVKQAYDEGKSSIDNAERL